MLSILRGFYELISRSTRLNDVAKIEHIGVPGKSRDHEGGTAGENRIRDSVEFVAMPDVFQILPEDVFLRGFYLVEGTTLSSLVVGLIGHAYPTEHGMR